MKIIKFNKGAKLTNIVLALGNFDGVHIGHKKILQSAVKYAKNNKLSCFAMTFDPHPQEVVNPARGLCLLTTLPERIELMKAIGLDGVIVKKFDKGIASLTAEKFIRDFLIKQLKVNKVFIGYDFAFGRGRAGNIHTLKKLGGSSGFTVTNVSPVMTHGHIVKSSTIREMLAKGDFYKAIKLLGHPYSFTGKVIYGQGRGRKLGFPTANISVAKDKLVPKHGVYYAKWGGKKCAMFIGSRPTFGKESFAIEAHIINFKGSLRGDVIRLDLYGRLRDEIHFSDVEDLKKRIAMDVDAIKKKKF